MILVNYLPKVYLHFYKRKTLGKRIRCQSRAAQAGRRRSFFKSSSLYQLGGQLTHPVFPYLSRCSLRLAENNICPDGKMNIILLKWENECFLIGHLELGSFLSLLVWLLFPISQSSNLRVAHITEHWALGIIF